RWCKPPLSSARFAGVWPSNPCSPSNCASAMPPSPPPKRHKNSRRLVPVVISIHKQKFVQVKNNTAGIREALRAAVGPEFSHLGGGGGATKREFESIGKLRLKARASSRKPL